MKTWTIIGNLITNSLSYKCERQEMEEHLNQATKEHLELSTLEILRLKGKVMIKEH